MLICVNDSSVMTPCSPLQQSVDHLLKGIITAQDGAGHAPLQGAAVVPQAKVEQIIRRLLPLLEEKYSKVRTWHTVLNVIVFPTIALC